MAENNLKKMRERLLMSKSELARKAGVSVLTIDRIEKNGKCRLETKRKILFALGLSIDEKHKVFSDDEEE
jgi:DNA-binding XRE family transcriptional regulator